MGFDNLCNTTLVLSLNIQSNTLPTPSETTTTTQSSPKSSSTPHKSSNNNNNNNNSFFNSFEPSLTLGLSGGGATATPTPTGGGGGNSDRYRQASPNSAVSSFSNVSVKREREFGSEEVEIETGAARIVDEDEDSYNTRKKLRLTKEQSALLEDSFKEHSTLNPQKQKQALARQLNLRPRQVEVWFQNRRARTKLKQTEVDCEFLRKCCETLTDENKRLHKELQDLKALKLAQPFYMQIPAATLSMCPSCERITGTGGEAVANTPIAPFAISAAKSHHHLYNPFTNPSAAC